MTRFSPPHAPLASLADRLRFLLITSFGLGLAPIAPGTWGTLGGVALAVAAQIALPAMGWHGRAPLALVLWIASAALLAWGCLQSDFVDRVFPSKDPGAFVLDEVVGYAVGAALYTTLRGELGPVDHAALFVVFRIFDVLKIQPARRLEAIPGAVGIMFDDVAAGLYAGAVYLLLAPLIPQ